VALLLLSLLYTRVANFFRVFQGIFELEQILQTKRDRGTLPSLPVPG
jgi:hypothetical protein